MHWPALKGLRLAICLIVLMTPPELLMSDQRERASLLAPFLLVALGAGGAVLVRRLAALRAVSGLTQLVLAAHVVVTLRLTLQEGDPRLADLGLAGKAAFVLGVALGVVAALQWVLLLRDARRPELAEPEIA